MFEIKRIGESNFIEVSFETGQRVTFLPSNLKKFSLSSPEDICCGYEGKAVRIYFADGCGDICYKAESREVAIEIYNKIVAFLEESELYKNIITEEKIEIVSEN